MYINKVIFMEYYEVTNLKQFGFPMETDYGTSEITSDMVQNLREELINTPEKYSFTLQEYEDEMKKSLGEAYDMLLNDELDFILVV